MHDAFRLFVALHIATGSIGLLAFWVPVVGRKGGDAHRRWGRVFTWSMLATGAAAVGISTCTILDPLGTHPHLVGSHSEVWIRDVFGWMMLCLAVLTVNLAWYGWLCVKNARDHRANREWRNLALQAALLAAAANCAWQAWATRMPLLYGVAVLGFATVATNLWFLYSPRPPPGMWLKEHVKALVGAGISVYTAFMAFGLVRTVPSLALHPALWAVPLTIGLGLILYHRWDIGRKYARTVPPPTARALS
ncbi:MAG: hypothetical protein O9284_12190 [Steroidobacteraceae bacterium]|jgi:hypothetical protein|nr:hypothetical protein [Steroidobacteraceae bacterium]